MHEASCKGLFSSQDLEKDNKKNFRTNLLIKSKDSSFILTFLIV